MSLAPTINQRINAKLQLRAEALQIFTRVCVHAANTKRPVGWVETVRGEPDGMFRLVALYRYSKNHDMTTRVAAIEE